MSECPDSALVGGGAGLGSRVGKAGKCARRRVDTAGETVGPGSDGAVVVAEIDAGRKREDREMPTIEMLTPDEIHERRERLLAQAGMSEDELRRRAADYTLTSEQSAILDELSDLDFLLRA